MQDFSKGLKRFSGAFHVLSMGFRGVSGLLLGPHGDSRAFQGVSGVLCCFTGVPKGSQGISGLRKGCS